MTIPDLSDLITEGEALLAALAEETRGFVSDTANLDEEPAAAFTEKREHLLKGLEKIDASLSERLASCTPPREIESLSRYRELRDATYHEVMALDKEIMERAQEKLASLSTGLSELAHGKQALNGYRPAVGKMPGVFNREA